MPRRAFGGCCAGTVSGDGGAVRAQINARHGRRRRAGGRAGLPLHLLRHAVSPAVLQLR